MTATACALLIATLASTACPLPDPRAGTALEYGTMKGFTLTDGDDVFRRFAPIYLVEHFEETFNRIGTPAARLANNGEEDVYVDPGTPTYYLQKVSWQAEDRVYTNLIYRVHFEMSVSNDNSRDGGKGYNVGLLTIVTLNEAGKPVWVNNVGTCGCFHAIQPTNYTPQAACPPNWDFDALNVYGETLPGRLEFPEEAPEDIRPVVFLRAGSHRVADVQIASLASVREKYELLPAGAAPIEDLKHLKLGEGETSFYYEDGDKQGLVKGAYKRGEAMLLGLWMGDGRVGQDRIYGPPEELPRGFYTTIDRRKKSDSDMWDYRSFLEQDGWKP